MTLCIILIVSLICVSNAFFNEPHITGETPSSVPCTHLMCNGRPDGNYEYYFNRFHRRNYFVQCSNGMASCQACWPSTLEFSFACNQCLYTKSDACITTEKWQPATTFICPDLCPIRGYDFSGNIEDFLNPHQYIACWQGMTVGCVACPAGLEFNEELNACLYDGKYITKSAQHA